LLEIRVRNGRLGFRWLAAGVSVMLSFPAVAQSMRTAEGAQQFLADMAKNAVTRVHFVDAAGRANYVTGIHTGEVKTIKGGLRKQTESVATLPERVVDKQLSDLRASVLEAIDAWGRPSLCTTRITEVTAPPYDDVKSDVANDTRSFSWTVTHTNEAWKYEPLTKFTSPAEVIDWSSAKVSRNNDGSVTVTSKGQLFPTIYLTYVATDADWADRIEYAMKFLMMSCGENTSVGL
jgi:hypothetical protein